MNIADIIETKIQLIIKEIETEVITVKDYFNINNMEKYHNEKGQVGVIISPNFGGGWSTWNDNNPWLVFHKPLVKAVLRKNYEEIKVIAEKINPGGYFSTKDLEVVFLDQGTTFCIQEYDGSESIVIYEPENYFVA